MNNNMKEIRALIYADISKICNMKLPVEQRNIAISDLKLKTNILCEIASKCFVIKEKLNELLSETKRKGLF